MVRETWQCQKCGNEISFTVKGNWKESPIGKNCDCGGFWKFKPRVTKRKNRDIWRNIHNLLGIDFDNYEKSIKYANFNQKEMLKLESAIKKIKN